MSKKGWSTERGVSIVEILIVMLVLVIITTFAVIIVARARTDFQRQAVAREFKVYLERARFDSVKRRAAAQAEMARITLNGPASFTVALDFDENGILAAGETRQVNFADRSQTRILLSDTFNYPVTLRFDQRGHITAINGLNNPVDPLFTICSDCSQASPDQTVIAVSPTGTVAVLRDGQSPATLPTPTMTNSAVSINCYVLYTNTNTSCSLN